MGQGRLAWRRKRKRTEVKNAMMKIKLAESTQLSAVYRFYREICEALKRAEYSSLWVYGAHPSEESLKQAVEQNNLYLGWQGARVAAAVVLEEGPEGWALHLLAVQPAFRRQNLGREMLARMADLARARGGTKLLLDVVGDNLPAIRLYERLGFAPTGRRQEFQDFCGHVALREYALAL